MQTSLRKNISKKDRFLLKIKYGASRVDARKIEECDYKYFEKLGEREVYEHIGLITEQMAGLIDFDSFDGDLWDLMLRRIPEFGIYCDWNKLLGLDWYCLLCHQPQFAERCDWSKISDDHWDLLLQTQPQLAKYRK